MRTPKEYTTNLKNNIITAEMLADCIYSVNKRAKNYRDKADEYRKMRYDTYNNEEKNRDKMKEMYSYKEKFLELLTPVCVHEKVIHKTHRVFYSDEYVYDPIEDIDYHIEEYEIYEYFELYKVADKSFHKPLGKYSYREEFKTDLPIEEIDFTTFGQDITDLISLNFVKKVLELIESDNYTLEVEYVK